MTRRNVQSKANVILHNLILITTFLKCDAFVPSGTTNMLGLFDNTVNSINGFIPHIHHLKTTSKTNDANNEKSFLAMSINSDDDDLANYETQDNRRSFLSQVVTSSSLLLLSSNQPTFASDTSTTETAAITDKIFLEFQGLPSSIDSTSPGNNRVVIGLFGKDAPQPVSMLKQLVSRESGGLQAPCKPRETRMLQREQLEANKVFNACKESEDSGSGVSYDLSTVWRVDKGKRIDVGAVAGKYVAREYPTFKDTSPTSSLRHTIPGTVSVRRGNDSGFGFTIAPSSDSSAVASLNEDNIVVGRILEGMDVMEQLNDLPVVQSSSVNYMSLTGGAKGKNAPDRSCRYGGPMYCNELKPLKKITVIRCGLL